MSYLKVAISASILLLTISTEIAFAEIPKSGDRFFPTWKILFPVLDSRTTSATWTCETEQWIGTPVLENGLFKGSIGTNCTVEGATGEGLVQLENYILNAIVDGAQVHAGPISEIYENLPSTYFDLTHFNRNGADTIDIRSDAHIATDLQNRFTYTLFSKQINASGMASFIRKLDVRAEVLPLERLGAYAIRISNTTHVKKPWYAPGGTFEREVKKTMIEEFVKNVQATLPRVADNL